MKTIIRLLKKIIDKQYYKYYTEDKETLIRQMFPWIQQVWEYKKLSLFLQSNGPQQINDIIEIIWAYYRWEVERLNMEWKFSEVERYQWLVDFSQSLRDYQEYVLTEK